jgi:DNA-binding winged helix-turn-helix (wHTH) protein
MTIRFDRFELDEGRRLLLRDGEPLHVAAKQFALLQLLIEHRPNAISKRELYDRLWPNTYVSDANLPSLIAELRSLLDDDARESRFIRTVHGFGYAFCGAIDDAPARIGIENAVATLIGEHWTIRLAPGETILGRDPSLRAAIDDPSVSRRHAAIACEDGGCQLRDLGSKNGTSLGGVRVGETPRELHDGDAITIGGVRLVFHRTRPASTITMIAQAR